MTGTPIRVAPRDVDRDWRRRGACLDDPDLQHPTGYSTGYRAEVDAARNVCLLDCPVIDVCRDWILAYEAGMSHFSRFGVWAALTPRERWQLDVKSRAAQCHGGQQRSHGGNTFDPQVLAEVARLLADGRSGRAIARELGISETRTYRMVTRLRASAGASGPGEAGGAGDGS